MWIILTVLFVLINISHGQNKCFYHPGLSGTKCLNTASSTYTCCPPDHQCNNGQCVSNRGNQNSDDPTVYTSVMIGVGVGVLCLIVIIGGIVYRHQRRVATTGRTSGIFSEFFPSRRNISVGYRVRSTTSQTPEIHQELPKSNP